jgi:hypothetical protein
MIPAVLKKWLAFGSGLGIEILGPHGSESLDVAAVSVRPSGIKVLGTFRVEDFPHQPAGVWGTNIAEFARKLGLSHKVATVALPRQDVIVRTLSLPGVSDKDLGAAVSFQLDSLHPYDENDVVTSWTRLPRTSAVMVAIARRTVVERYATLFAEAGLKLGGFTCSAAAIYSSLRLLGATPPSPLLAARETESGIEVYGESSTRPVYSLSTQLTAERALAVASSELRLEAPLQASALEPLPTVTALASACPWHVLPINLLPEAQRESSSAMAWIPTAALGVIILGLAGTLLALPRVETSRYQQSLAEEISHIEPGANRAAALDRQIDLARKRGELLDSMRRHPKADMDSLQEMTRVIPPNTWLNSLELTAKQLMIIGETDQAAPLLKIIDSSPAFEGSEFVGSPVRIQTVERFQIRTNRKGQR